MGRWLTALVVAMVAFGPSAASALERAEGAKRWEVTGFPGGGILFTEGSDDADEPDFGDYALGASLTYNWNRWNRHWGIEGEVGGGLGVDQRIGFRRGSTGDCSAGSSLGSVSKEARR